MASGPMLRAPTTQDVGAIATIWYEGWRDGHLGNVPGGLLDHRRPDHFRDRVPQRLLQTTVATLDSRVVGFVTAIEDEVEQLYVDRAARGGGVAAALLNHAEGVIACRFALAWLAVATGNARARRFYSRNGWRDAGAFDYQAEIAGGTFVVPCHRYEKRLAVAAPGSDRC